MKLVPGDFDIENSDLDFLPLGSFRYRCERFRAIATGEFLRTIDDPLRCVDAGQSEVISICGLAVAIRMRRIGIRPADVVPVVHVFTEDDGLHSGGGLAIQFRQNSVGWRAIRTTLRGE